MIITYIDQLLVVKQSVANVMAEHEHGEAIINFEKTEMVEYEGRKKSLWIQQEKGEVCR